VVSTLVLMNKIKSGKEEKMCYVYGWNTALIRSCSLQTTVAGFISEPSGGYL